ncbi:MAG: uracil-DNA glycosylase [bacterium]
MNAFPDKWAAILPEERVLLAEKLSARAEAERESGIAVYPPADKVYRALALTPPERVKVVILGQDPYHGAGQANGLAFSVESGVKLPPSLKNIYLELSHDLGILRSDGDLTDWAREGVLLLNTSLTVREGQPGSHAAWGWQKVTGAVVGACEALPQPVVFFLWGRHAHSLCPEETRSPEKRYLLSSHPSPLGARKACGAFPPFLGSRPFSQGNTWLEAQGIPPVRWG